MNRKFPGFNWGAVVILGAVWGFSEAALGMGLRSCASFFSGSIMTGAAFFFIAASWILVRHWSGVALLVVLASLFKLFDALLLSLPVQHGAVANPIFAFLMEGLAFLVLISIISDKIKHKSGGQALLGGMSALLAVNLFPLVKHMTGIPACTFPGTGYPLSLYYAPLAIFLSFITIPLGFQVGSKMEAFRTQYERLGRAKRLGYLTSPVAVILCLALIAFIRLD